LQNFFEKQLCIFFTPINLSHYSVQKYWYTVTEKWIVYEMFYILCQNEFCQLISQKVLNQKEFYCVLKSSQDQLQECTIMVPI